MGYQVNAIYIATPPAFHEAYTLQAFKAGKNVYVENLWPWIQCVVKYFLDDGPNPCPAEEAVEVMEITDVFTEKITTK